jgi:hypothetical protein
LKKFSVIIFILVSLSPVHANYYGRDSLASKKSDKKQTDRKFRKRNGIWFTPNKVEEINGLSVGVATVNIKNSKKNIRDSLTVHGLNLEFSTLAIYIPIVAIGLPIATIEFIIADTKTLRCVSFEEMDNYNWDSISYDVKIYGANIVLFGGLGNIKIVGFNLGVCNPFTQMKGVSIAILGSFMSDVKGVEFSTVWNEAQRLRGVQIGLVNCCYSLHGFQFGLWNMNPKRSLPFINWQFKAKEKKVRK